MKHPHYTYHLLMGIPMGSYLVDFFEIAVNRFVVRIWSKTQPPFYLSINEKSLDDADILVHKFLRGKLLPSPREVLLLATGKVATDNWTRYEGVYCSHSFTILRIGSEQNGIFEYVLRVPIGVNLISRSIVYRDIYEKTPQPLSLDFLIEMVHVLIDEFTEGVMRNDTSLYYKK